MVKVNLFCIYLLVSLGTLYRTQALECYVCTDCAEVTDDDIQTCSAETEITTVAYDSTTETAAATTEAGTAATTVSSLASDATTVTAAETTEAATAATTVSSLASDATTETAAVTTEAVTAATTVSSLSSDATTETAAVTTEAATAATTVSSLSSDATTETAAVTTEAATAATTVSSLSSDVTATATESSITTTTSDSTQLLTEVSTDTTDFGTTIALTTFAPDLSNIATDSFTESSTEFQLTTETNTNTDLTSLNSETSSDGFATSSGFAPVTEAYNFDSTNTPTTTETIALISNTEITTNTTETDTTGSAAVTETYNSDSAAVTETYTSDSNLAQLPIDFTTEALTFTDIDSTTQTYNTFTVDEGTIVDTVTGVQGDATAASATTDSDSSDVSTGTVVRSIPLLEEAEASEVTRRSSSSGMYSRVMSRSLKQSVSDTETSLRCVVAVYEVNGTTSVVRGCSTASNSSETRCSEAIGNDNASVTYCNLCEDDLCNSAAKSVFAFAVVLISLSLHFILA